MNDVTKKRLIGVLILVAIGILIPVLLSRCMGSDAGDADRGQMRVYDVQPDGQAAPASNNTSAGNDAADAQAGSDASNTPDMPDAVSPQSQAQSDNDEADDEGFSTPPIHGKQNQGSGETDTASRADRARTTSQASSRESSSDNDSGSTDQRASQSQSQSPSSSRGNESASSGHDYGASTQGRSSNSAGSTSKANATNESSATRASAGPERQSISGWVVQVGSFSEQGNARDLARRLSSDYSASYTPGQVNGKTWYRVNVGPFANEAQARSAASRLKQQGHGALVRHLP